MERVCEVSLGWREASSYGEGGWGMRSCCPTTSQFLGLPGFWFQLTNNTRYVTVQTYIMVYTVYTCVYRNIIYFNSK